MGGQETLLRCSPIYELGWMTSSIRILPGAALSILPMVNLKSVVVVAAYIATGY